MNNDTTEIIELFPTVILKKDLNRNITDNEFRFLNQDRPIDQNKSNISSLDDDILEHPDMINIKQFCLSGVNDYMNKIYAPIDVDAEMYITQSWLNWTTSDQYHHEHHHPNSILSGVFYLNTTSEDEILFVKERTRTNMLLSMASNSLYENTEVALPTPVGRLYVFPSYLNHKVSEKKDDGLRISLAFNTFIRGTIGSKTGKFKLTLR